MASRKKVPLPIKRQVLFEAFHQCAVCCQRAALELAHIIPWSKVREHTVENMICLCATCHTQADKEGWAPKYFRMYKDVPCALRKARQHTSDLREEILVTLPGRLEDYDQEKLQDLESAISAFLDVPRREVRVRAVKAHSVQVSIEVPADAAGRLRKAFEKEELRLFTLINLADNIQVAHQIGRERSLVRLFEDITIAQGAAWAAFALALVTAAAALVLWILFQFAPSSGGVSPAVLNPPTPIAPRNPATTDEAATVWMMGATALALLVTAPGLAMFYSGMVQAKNALSVQMQVFSSFAVIVLLWCVFGYSLAFTDGNVFLGGVGRLFLDGVVDPIGQLAAVPTITAKVLVPELLVVAYHAALAGFACCVTLGAFVERMKFSAAIIFVVVWFTASYVPLAHMVWFAGTPDEMASGVSPLLASTTSGLLRQWGTLDFAGGTVVHLNAGVAGLVGAYMIGKRIGSGREAMIPNNLALTMAGASLMWFGWLGLVGGAALEPNARAVLAIFNAMVCAAGALLAWAFCEWILKGKVTISGATSGLLAGLVAITPAAGYASPMGAAFIGLVAAVTCVAFVTRPKRMFGADDSLDVFAIHGVAAIVGLIMVVWMADVADHGSGFLPVRLAQLLIQLQAIGVTVIWAMITSWLACVVANALVGLRVLEEVEAEGLDVHEHGQSIPRRSEW